MNKKYLIILIFSIILASCTKENIETKKYYKTTTVWTWTIESSNWIIWYTDWKDSVLLWAKLWWKLTKINVEVWDKVTKWQILAELDWTEAKTWYNWVAWVIENLNNLKISTQNVYNEQINVWLQKIEQIKKSIEIAELSQNATTTWLNNTQTTTQNQLDTISSQVNQANLALETAKLNYENQKNTLLQKESDIYNNSKISINNSIILWNNIIDFLDTIFWVTESNKSKNDSYEIYLWAKNTQLKSQIENDLNKLIVDFNWIKSNYWTIKSNEDIENLLNKTYSLFNNDVANILKLAYQVMDSSIDTTTLTQTTLNTYKTNITNFQTNTQSVILTVSWNYFVWLKWSLDNISNFKKESRNALDMLKKQVEVAEKQVEIANKNYTQAQSWIKWQIDDISSKTNIASKQIELLQEQLKEANISIESIKKQLSAKLNEIDTQISQAQAQKDASVVAIDNSKIIAPFNWVVTKKILDIWSIVWAWTPVISISDNSNIIVNIWVLDEVKEKLNENNSVLVEIDGINSQKTWIITKIYPSKNEITKKTNIEISLENTSWEINIWSMAKVYFKNDNENNWIIIPNNAILQKYLVPWVYILKENKAIFTNIEILKSNNNFTQINWLNIWDIIITDWKENIYDQEELN